MSTEDLSGEINQAPSTDEQAASSTAPEAEVKPEGEGIPSPEGSTEASATETPEEPKKVNKVQERINQLTREKHEVRQKNADLEKKLAEALANKVPEKAPDLVAPKEEDFDDYSNFQTANAKFIADTAANVAYDRITAETKTSAEEAKQTQRQEVFASKQKAFKENVESKKADFENFDEVAYGHQFMDLELAEQLYDMEEKGPEVAYHLGAHLDEAARIFALEPVQRARELTKLEFQVVALKPKKVSDAPEPISPLGNAEKVNTDGVNGENIQSADDWAAWRNKQVHGE